MTKGGSPGLTGPKQTVKVFEGHDSENGGTGGELRQLDPDKSEPGMRTPKYVRLGVSP